jgi:hypothetical protein
VGERCPSEGGPAPSPDRPPGALGGPVGPALVDAHQISAAWGAPAWPKPSTAARRGPSSAGAIPRLAPAGSGSPTHTKAGRAVIPHERGEDSPEEQGHERPHHEGPPTRERPSDRTALLLGTPTVDKCTLQGRKFSVPGALAGRGARELRRPPRLCAVPELNRRPMEAGSGGESQMLSKRYRLKLAIWTVVREPGQPSPRHR